MVVTGAGQLMEAKVTSDEGFANLHTLLAVNTGVASSSGVFSLNEFNHCVIDEEDSTTRYMTEAQRYCDGLVDQVLWGSLTPTAGLSHPQQGSHTHSATAMGSCIRYCTLRP